MPLRHGQAHIGNLLRDAILAFSVYLMVKATSLKRTRLADTRRPSQDDVAQAMGITQPFYLRVEQGERAVSAELAEGLADYFGVPVNSIFRATRYSSELETVSAEA